MDDNNYYVSKERLEELKKKLEQMKKEGRREVGEKLRQARDFGDVSESTEYENAREEQMQLETRIAELEELLKRAVIIKKVVGSTVTVGCVVTVKRDGKTAVYEIVGSDEASPEKGKISNESPIGRAFMGRKVGDKVKVATPAGTAEYEIIKIE